MEILSNKQGTLDMIRLELQVFFQRQINLHPEIIVHFREKKRQPNKGVAGRSHVTDLHHLDLLKFVWNDLYKIKRVRLDHQSNCVYLRICHCDCYVKNLSFLYSGASQVAGRSLGVEGQL
jgi:hypothetical protein